MRFIDEYRDEAAAQRLVTEIKRLSTRPWAIMEICGGQTHTLLKFGILDLLPKTLTLIHGPGCPVCVTSLKSLDQALAIAQRPGVIFTSFGDMLRVPGSQTDLLKLKAQGYDIRIVYSPLDALKLAQKNPDREVVFFAVGFETTAPANAMTVWQAKQLGLSNFSLLCAHVLVPPAMQTILAADDCQIQGFLAAGHVCTVMGYWEYEALAANYQIPIVVTGFEPLDLLQGIYLTLKALEEGRFGVENQYGRVVSRAGNKAAQQMLQQVFTICDRDWRGIGLIPQSGYGLKPEFALFDAAKRFEVADLSVQESPLCLAGEVLQGKKKPSQCPAFGQLCTPTQPLGAPMVSSEGACAAYFHYRSEGFPKC